MMVTQPECLLIQIPIKYRGWCSTLRSLIIPFVCVLLAVISIVDRITMAVSYSAACIGISGPSLSITLHKTFRWRCWSQYGSPSIFVYTWIVASCKSVSVFNRTERATNARPCTTPSTTCTEINYDIQRVHHVCEECTTTSTTCAEIDYDIQRLHLVPRLHLPTDYMTHITYMCVHMWQPDVCITHHLASISSLHGCCSLSDIHFHSLDQWFIMLCIIPSTIYVGLQLLTT